MAPILSQLRRVLATRELPPAARHPRQRMMPRAQRQRARRPPHKRSASSEGASLNGRKPTAQMSGSPRRTLRISGRTIELVTHATDGRAASASLTASNDA